ncbi:hypothetical protein [Chitinophaga sp. Cy-1792]|uniref:hypothetical protein n=1 Tax=Chitinophaga sp. Cy-1792 TaxID=2608339 RepID=UPI00142091AA|nr:hypothetical protein [Chitinophaga sp. Cy-1792]NIG55066.1 hypothetical protein [Chitinophaga sp. Cy-1792]
MKTRILTAGLLILSFASFAQNQTADDDNIEYELKSNEKLGYIITKDDQKVEGVVKLAGSEKSPWDNQKKVRFLAKENIDPTAKRQHFKVLKVDDLKEYVAVENNAERRFRVIKFSNMRAAMSMGDGIGSTIKGIKNASSTTHMAEVIIDGPITMYRLYGYPTMVAVGNADVAQAEQDENNLRNNPDILVQKGDDRPRELRTGDIKKLVDDCSAVSTKLAAGEFHTYDPAKEEKKKTGFGKLIKGETERLGSKLEDMGVEIFTAYNTTCKQ